MPAGVSVRLARHVPYHRSVALLSSILSAAVLMLATTIAVIAPASGSSASAQVPQIPATFYGSATIDGKAPPEGSEVRGIINGLDCTQPGAAGTITAEGVGAYVINVMHESQKPGCGKNGVTVSFTIAGQAAGQTATWAQGPQPLGLNVGTGEVKPLPSNVPVPTEATQATAVAGNATADNRSPGSSANTPLPPGTSVDGSDDDDGPGVAGIAIVLLLAIAVVAGAAGMAVSKRKSPPGPPGGGGTGEPT